MIRIRGRALRWALLAVATSVALAVLLRFPWNRTIAALTGCAPALLAGALAVNLVSLVAKGWAWHLLLRRVCRSRWLVAQEANLIGCAVNSLSVSVMGEAARVQHIVSRDRVPIESAMASVVWARAAEALGLALFMLAAPSFLRLPPILHGLQIGGGGALALMLGAVWTGRWPGLLRMLPAASRSAAARIAEMGHPKSLILPTILAVVNWGAQWATYHLTLLAFHVPASFATSFTALVVANLSGILRVTPGNIGLAQGAMVLALLPFGVPPHTSVAAALALQGLQIVPVLALAMATVGWKGLSPEPARSIATSPNR